MRPGFKTISGLAGEASVLLLLGGGESPILAKAGITDTLPDGSPDAGIIVGSATDSGIDAFVTAISAHRNFARESDPPRV